jgi:hypothetical protein
MNVSLQQKLVSDEKETRSHKTGKHAKIALFPPVARSEEFLLILVKITGAMTFFWRSTPPNMSVGKLLRLRTDVTLALKRKTKELTR